MRELCEVRVRFGRLLSGIGRMQGGLQRCAETPPLTMASEP